MPVSMASSMLQLEPEIGKRLSAKSEKREWSSAAPEATCSSGGKSSEPLPLAMSTPKVSRDWLTRHTLRGSEGLHAR